MKKLLLCLSTFCIFVTLAICLTLPASAETYEGDCGADGDNVKWSLDTDTGKLTISGSGEMEDHCPYYNYNDSIESVEIQEGVTSIGDYAFEDCSSLKSITIPEGITSIGDWAFRNCSSLKSITIPEGVTSIGWFAFVGCDSLTNTTIPDSIIEIDKTAFPDSLNWKTKYKNGYYFGKNNKILLDVIDKTVTEFEFAEGVTSIASSAFDNCNRLKSIIIPDSVTNMGVRVFANCSRLTSITLPKGITSIGYYMFSSCRNLTNITIPEGVTSIDSCAFSNCSSLTSITIPKNITNIGDHAFAYCSNLTSVTIPEKVTSIGSGAFYSCYSLTSIRLPSGISAINEDVFTHCSGIKTIIFCGTEEEWNNISKALYWDDYFYDYYDVVYHKYDFSSCTLVDENKHTCKCEYCDSSFEAEHGWDNGEVTTPATHLEEGVMTYTCTDCGATRTEPIDKTPDHAYGNWSKLNDSQHERECACGEKDTAYHVWNDGAVTTYPSHLEEGVMTYTCNDCGATKTEPIDKTPDHAYGNWSKLNDSQHERECACGEKDTAYHVWNDGAVTTYPSHLEEGVMTYTCNDCGATRTEPIDKTPEHTYGEWSKHNDTQHVKECECGDKQYANHEWDNGTVTIEATHIKEGEMTYTCLDCGETRTEPISKTKEHSYSEWVKKDEKQHEKVCACGNKVFVNHTWDNGEITKPATHLEEGVMTYTCEDCNATRTEPIAKITEHTYSDWARFDDKQHVKECACGDKQYSDHSFDEGKITTEPTHLKEGVMTYTCKDCGATISEPVEKLKDHEYGEWVKINDQQHERECACGENQCEKHLWDNVAIIERPTDDKDGLKTYTCVCGDSYSEVIPKLGKDPEETKAPDETVKDEKP